LDMCLYSTTEITLDIKRTTAMARMESVIFILSDKRKPCNQFLNFTNIDTKIQNFKQFGLLKNIYCFPCILIKNFINLRSAKKFRL